VSDLGSISAEVRGTKRARLYEDEKPLTSISTLSQLTSTSTLSQLDGELKLKEIEEEMKLVGSLETTQQIRDLEKQVRMLRQEKEEAIKVAFYCLRMFYITLVLFVAMKQLLQ
jgi:hypothetical protein